LNHAWDFWLVSLNLQKCRGFLHSLGRNLTHFRFSGHSPIGVIISMVKVLLAGAFPVIFAIYRS
jgi:hypothetical protein